MNNRFYTLCKGLMAVALLGAASNAIANTVTLNVGSYGNLGGYGGGEFTAVDSGLSTSSYASTTSSGGTFETFCMAYNEEFIPGNWGGPAYNFFLSNNTFGPAAGTLTEGTAWLYSQFAAGTLVGYDYNGSTRAASAQQLQLAIWSLQNSIGAPSASGDPFLTEVYNALGSEAAAKTAAAPGYDGVQIMVLTNNVPGTAPSYAQPQLYYIVPDGGTTVLLLVLALMAIAAFRRRLV